MQFNEIDGRLRIERDGDEKKPFLARLARIEGQVRGLRQMIEEDRYCGDVLQQTAAITAALREVALLCVHDHLDAWIDVATQKALGGRRDLDEVAPAEITKLLRAVLKQ